MHGFVIEVHPPCKHCRNLRTARRGRTSFCFNCRTYRDVTALLPAPPRSQTSYCQSFGDRTVFDTDQQSD
jgi:hypothetical protein